MAPTVVRALDTRSSFRAFQQLFFHMLLVQLTALSNDVYGMVYGHIELCSVVSFEIWIERQCVVSSPFPIRSGISLIL